MAAKVLLFIETGGPGGAERVVAGLAAGLSAAGDDIGVLTLRRGWLTDTLKTQGSRHYQIESSRGFDISLPFRIASLIRREGYQVLHSHLLDSNFYGAIAARLAGVKHVATEHGDVHHINKKRFSGAKLRTLALLGSSVTAVSEFSRRRLQELGIPSERLSVVGNPILTPQTVPAGSRRAVRDELGIPPGPEQWIWLHVANLRPVKDQETLIAGFAESLSTSTVPQWLLLAGDGPERRSLEEQSARLGVKERIRFLGFRDDVSQLLHAADGFILSSRSEAMPMSLLEAAAQGLALIGSAVGGIPEVIRDNDTGFLFPAGDPGALARTITRALKDQSTTKLLADRAKQEVLHKFSLEAVLSCYRKLY